MKRYTILLLLMATLGASAWAASANLTTNGSSCPVATNTTALVLGLADKGGATLTVAGTWTGTISFYGTGSGGMVWTALSATPLGSSTAVTTTTGNGTWQVNASGFTNICMLSSASMTGTANVTITPGSPSAKSNGGGGGGGGSPGGSDTQAQFNNNGSFAGSPGIIFNDSTNALVTVNQGNGTNAGGSTINFGFPGTNGTGAKMRDYVDQTTGEIYRESVSSAAFGRLD